MTGLDMIIFLNTDSVKNIVISPNFLMWKFCGIIINSLFFVDKFTLYNTSYFSNEKKIFFLILINN